MTETKYWYQSKTVWGALVAILAGMLDARGIEVDEPTQAQIIDGVVAIAGIAGGLFALYGRLTADAKLG